MIILLWSLFGFIAMIMMIIFFFDFDGDRCLCVGETSRRGTCFDLL